MLIYWMGSLMSKGLKAGTQYKQLNPTLLLTYNKGKLCSVMIKNFHYY